METHELLAECRCTLIRRDGTLQAQSEEILREHSAALEINGVPAAEITCIPEHLDLLVLGRLLTEGLISSAAEIAEMDLSDTAGRIRVTLAGSGAAADRLTPVVPVFWKPEWIFDMADRFAAGMPLHEKTWAAHSCILARDGTILFVCEDISRHNALDKAVGFALKNDIPLTQCAVYSSGRIPADMAAKAVRAGIPILASKASPTAAAVEFAGKHRLTLICAARKDRMKLFSGPLPEETPSRKEAAL